MTQKGKRLATLLTLFGVTYLLAWGLSRDNEAYWRDQATKIHEGMSEAEVEAILFPHQHSKFSALYDAIDKHLLHRRLGFIIAVGGSRRSIFYYQVAGNLRVAVTYRIEPPLSRRLQVTKLGSNANTNTAPTLEYFVLGQAELKREQVDN